MVFVLEGYSTFDRIFVSGGESVNVRSYFTLKTLVCSRQLGGIIMFRSFLRLCVNEYTARAI